VIRRCSWLPERCAVFLADSAAASVAGLAALRERIAGAFLIIDSANFHKHKTDIARQAKDRIELEGSHNFLWLFVIIALGARAKGRMVERVAHWSALAAAGDRLGLGAWPGRRQASRRWSLPVDVSGQRACRIVRQPRCVEGE